jgi:hypothetical protein
MCSGAPRGEKGSNPFFDVILREFTPRGFDAKDRVVGCLCRSSRGAFGVHSQHKK